MSLLPPLPLHQAEDGEQGLAKLKSRTFDLVIVDFLMPNLGGVGCAAQFRHWEALNRPEGQRQIIMGISANADENAVNEGFQAGMDYFEPKPVSPESLKVRSLRSLIRGLVDSKRRTHITQHTALLTQRGIHTHITHTHIKQAHITCTHNTCEHARSLHLLRPTRSFSCFSRVSLFFSHALQRILESQLSATRLRPSKGAASAGDDSTDEAKAKRQRR